MLTSREALLSHGFPKRQELQVMANNHTRFLQHNEVPS